MFVRGTLALVESYLSNCFVFLIGLQLVVATGGLAPRTCYDEVRGHLK